MYILMLVFDLKYIFVAKSQCGIFLIAYYFACCVIDRLVRPTIRDVAKSTVILSPFVVEQRCFRYYLDHCMYMQTPYVSSERSGVRITSALWLPNLFSVSKSFGWLDVFICHLAWRCGSRRLVPSQTWIVLWRQSACGSLFIMALETNLFFTSLDMIIVDKKKLTVKWQTSIIITQMFCCCQGFVLRADGSLNGF